MCAVECTAGLRIDVDTMRGTRLGVTNLLNVLAKKRIKSTFFFSVGPDNMGRHLWRALRPAFFKKMIRSKAAKLYGWDILLRGTLWPGPVIGLNCDKIIRRTVEAGHEIGLHAWDHHLWQNRIKSMSRSRIESELHKSMVMLERLAQIPVSCSAAPGWRCNNRALLEKESFHFLYNSDCRGYSIFYPEVNGKKISQPQIPTTLPTYDELIGRNGITEANYNTHLLSLFRPGKLNVLTIHAEAEGLMCLAMFEKFLSMAQECGTRFQPLKNLLQPEMTIGSSRMLQGNVAGRDGWISYQEAESRSIHE